MAFAPGTDQLGILANFGIAPLEQLIDGNDEKPGQLVQHARGYPVRAGFIFLQLLVTDAKCLSEFRKRHSGI